MEFHEKIKKRRNELNLSQKNIADKIGVAKSTYSLYETGAREPDVEKIKKIAIALNTTPDDLLDIPSSKTPKIDVSFVNKYNSLDKRGKDTIDTLLDFEYEQSQKRKSEKIIDINALEAYPHVPYYDVPASAGTGRYLDYSTMQIVAVNDDVPRNTDYILQVAGDSMEPKFSDGDYVYVSKSSSMSFGDIGIFYFDNNVYIKKYMADGLKSLNPAYQLIPQSEDISCLGKVIGKVCGDIYFE